MAATHPRTLDQHMVENKLAHHRRNLVVFLDVLDLFQNLAMKIIDDR